MALEDVMIKLTAALEANTKALASSGGKPGATATGGKTATTAKGPTMEDVKAAAVRVKDAKGTPVAKKLISDVGKSKELASVKPENFAALIAAFEKALAPADDGDGDEDGDGDSL